MLRMNSYIAEEDKVVEWTIEALSPFVMVDMMAYDPLGYTDSEHEYHKKAEFTELPFYKELINLQNTFGEELDKQAFIQKVLNALLGSVRIIIKNKYLTF